MSDEDNKKYCNGCATIRSQEDFYGKEYCYKCIYKEKLKLLPSKKIRKCAYCQNKLQSHQQKFCSNECFGFSNVVRKENYWLNKMKNPDHHWKYSKDIRPPVL